MIDHRQLKAARTVIGLTVHETAKLMHMGNSTIVRLETPEGVKTAHASTLRALEMFYQARGVEFTENSAGRGVLWVEGDQR